MVCGRIALWTPAPARGEEYQEVIMQITANIDDALLASLRKEYPTTSLEELVVQGSQKLIDDRLISDRTKTVQAEEAALGDQYGAAAAKVVRDRGGLDDGIRNPTENMSI